MNRAATLMLAVAGLASIGAHSPVARCGATDPCVAIPAGTVLLGEDGRGRPGMPTPVAAFRIDAHEVTNRQFAAFVAATGYRTRAERDGGSALFVAPTEPVSLDNAARWWRFVKGADWRHPQGPGSALDGHWHDPVVHIDRADAAGYAAWAGGFLPDVEQWERAARGGQTVPRDAMAWAFDHGKARANVWEGVFPMLDTGADGYAGIAPVARFPANGFGLYDMVGNVWEWVAGDGPVGLVKGGSFLCATNYCANFRPAAFQAQERDFPTSHIGFRVAYNQAAAASPGRRRLVRR